MADYRESSVSGTSYIRGRSMCFENPLGAAPSVHIQEDEVFNLGDQRITRPAGEINRTVGDMSVSFPLRNPLTNDLIPGQSATYQDLYVLLFSLYWHLAEERDAAQQGEGEA